MFKKNNKENLKPITLNIPKMAQRNQLNSNSTQSNAYLIETSRSPRISQLYQKIQQSIDQKAENESQDRQNQRLQVKIIIQTYNQTPTITNSQDSFNIWNDEQQLDGNIIENYTLRFRSFDNFIQNNVSQDEIAENILKLLGMKHKVKNLGKIPFFKEEPKATTNYFVPPQKAWRLFKKRPLNFIIKHTYLIILVL